MSSGPSEVEILSAESIALYTPTTSTYLRRSAESNIKGLETGFEGKADGFDKSSVRYGQRQEHQVERDGQIQQMKNTSLSAASEANHQPVGMRNGTKNGIIIPSDDQQPPNTMAFAHYERELPSSGPSTDVSFQLRSRRLSHAAKDGSRTPPRPIFPPPTDPLPSPPTIPSQSYYQSASQSHTPSPSISRLRMAPAPYDTISSSKSDTTIHGEVPPQTISPRSSSLLDSVTSPSATPMHARTPSGNSVLSPGYETAMAGPSRTNEPARSSRIPSRRLLQSALDLAQQAVELDRANDVGGALAMYRDAVARLRSVMERVGMELGPMPAGLGLPEQSEQEKEEIAHARRRRRSNSGRSEEEGKTLKGIHDAYIARIALLAAMSVSTVVNNKSQLESFDSPPDGGPHPTSAQADQFPSSVAGVIPNARPPVVRKRQASLSAALDDFASGGQHPSTGLVSEAILRKRASQGSWSSGRPSTLAEEAVGQVGGGDVEVLGHTSHGSSAHGSFPRSSSRGSRLGQTMSAGHKPVLMELNTHINLSEIHPPISPRRTSLQSFAGSDMIGSQRIITASTSSGTLNQRRAAQQDVMPSLSAPASEITTFRTLPPPPPPPPPPKSITDDGSVRTGERLGIIDALAVDPDQALKRQRSFSQPLARSLEKAPDEATSAATQLHPEIPNTAGGKVSTMLYSFNSANRKPEYTQVVAESAPSETAEATMGFALERPSAYPSPLPDPPPVALVRRPFYLLRQIHNSIVSPTGGFLNERLHLPRPLWTQSSAKLAALDTKVRVLEILAQNLSSVGRTGAALLYTEGMPQVAVREATKYAVDFTRELEDLEALLDEIQDKLGKKLGVGTAVIKGRKSGPGFGAFGSKLSRSLDRMTNGKTVDSSASYFEALARFSWECQVMDQHLACLLSPPSPTLYDALSKATRDTIESRLRRVADFLNTVVLAFILPDINVLLTRYLKLSSRYLED